MNNEGLKEPIDGLPLTLNKAGRRFVLEGPLDRLFNRTTKQAYYVYLFSDIIIYAQRKKKQPHKYVAHKYLANCLFIDYENSSKAVRIEHKNPPKINFLRKDKKEISLRYAFEIKHLEDKKPQDDKAPRDKEDYIFLAKNLDQKNVWKRDIERHINIATEEEGVVTDQSSSSFGEAYISGFNDPTESSSSFGSVGSLSGSMSSDVSSMVSAISPSDPSSVSTTPSESSMSTTPTEIWSQSASCNSDHWSDEGGSVEELDELEINEKALMGTADDGSTVVRAGSLNLVVWMLLAGEYAEAAFIKAFLFSHNSYTTPAELFDIIKEIYLRNSPPKELLVKYSTYDTRKKVLAFFRVWISNFFADDFDNKPMYGRVLEFINEIDREHAPEVNQIKIAILKANKERVLKKMEKRRKPPSLTARVPTSENIQRGALNVSAKKEEGPAVWGNKFIEFDLNLVAAHLTYTDHMLFKQVALSELAKMAWMNPKTSVKKAPNILKSTQMFNKLSQWVSTEIILSSSPKQCAFMIERFVSLASKCVEMRNYHTLMEILAGINRGFVERLKKSWSLVSSSTMETLQQLNDLMDPRSNFKNYRESLKKASLPCLPYFGIYLRDIVFTEEGNKDKTDDLVNYEKIQIIGKIYKEVLHFQKGKYVPCEDEAICTYFKPSQLWVMPDEVLYTRSRMAEPSMRPIPEDTDS